MLIIIYLVQISSRVVDSLHFFFFFFFFLKSLTFSTQLNVGFKVTFLCVFFLSLCAFCNFIIIIILEREKRVLGILFSLLFV